MADAAIHASISKMPLPEYASTPFITPPALSDARVAIVTTAGLTHRQTPKLWTMGDSGYRRFAHGDRDLVVAHVSSNFDRAGISADLNVAYPIDRLDELMAERDRFADPRRAARDDSDASELPAVAWMAYSIHGDELSSPDAALRLAYELAAGRDDVISGILRDVVVVIGAMKMLHPLAAKGPAVVADVHVAVGDSVDGGQVLLSFEAADHGQEPEAQEDREA